MEGEGTVTSQGHRAKRSPELKISRRLPEPRLTVAGLSRWEERAKLNSPRATAAAPTTRLSGGGAHTLRSTMGNSVTEVPRGRDVVTELANKTEVAGVRRWTADGWKDRVGWVDVQTGDGEIGVNTENGCGFENDGLGKGGLQTLRRSARALQPAWGLHAKPKWLLNLVSPSN